MLKEEQNRLAVQRGDKPSANADQSSSGEESEEMDEATKLAIKLSEEQA